MTPRERVLAVFGGEQPDRVPVNYATNPGIDSALKKHFRLEPQDDEGLRLSLGVDFRRIEAPYTGPKLHPDDPTRGMFADEWGIRRKWVDHGTGAYPEYVDFPLQTADVEQVEAWPLPSVDDYDYSIIPQLCHEAGDFALYTGGPGLCDVINKNGMLRGVEQTMLDLLTADAAALVLAKRRIDIQLEVTRRVIEAAAGRIDFIWIGEDLGTQHGPLISRETYLDIIYPFHRRFMSLAGSFELPVMLHSCGSSSWAFDDFIELGVTAVDTLQPEAKNMDPAYLKNTYGGRLAFHGCISTAGPVAMGSVGETDKYCRDILETMMPGGGYCFAPTHQLQDNTPVENAVAMYEAAKKYGAY